MTAAARRRRHLRREQLRHNGRGDRAREGAVDYYESELARARTASERRMLLADLYDEGAWAGEVQGQRHVNSVLAQKLDTQRDNFELVRRSVEHRGQRIAELEAELKRTAAALIRRSEELARLQREGARA